jgi:tetratricopeptide (TPR) repeat protein|nr:serine/threonine-protein kinase [Kofleriaceae bacterium]
MADAEVVAGGVTDDRARGTALGRYIVLDRIGAGGMGVVYAAYDPELDRKVAVKVLHGDRVSHDHQARLTREAQAMARLSHPNVVAVYDVGSDGSSVFVAMELIEGDNLTAWRAAHPRSWRDVVRVFVAAGDGLAAAHAKGLVHRDFKPDNVLIRAADDRVAVSDFGLARLLAEVPATDAAESPVAPRDKVGALDRTLTRAGALLGTPAYMAPEQHRGEPADARADQFAFCVALYEALYDERPFAAASGDALDSTDALALEVIKNNVRAAPRATAVPGWLRKLVLRGLASAPGERWPSMTPLLDALRSDPGRRARRLAVAGGVAAVALAATAMMWSRSDTEPPCSSADERVAAVWSPSVSAAAAAAFASTGKPYAVDTWRRAAAIVDDYTGRWSALHTETCQATEVRHEQSAELLDLRMACLNHRLAAVGALAELYRGRVDQPLLDKAVSAALALPPLDACSDDAQLRAVVPLPGDPLLRQRVAALEPKLAAVGALDQAGRYKDGLAAIAPLIDEAKTLAYPVPLADAMFTRVHMLDAMHDFKTASPVIEDAITAAANAHEDERTAVLVSSQEYALMSLGRVKEALALGPVADALLKRAGDPPRSRVAIENYHGLALQADGRYAEAEVVLRRAVALQETVAPHEGNLATARFALAAVLANQGKYPEALVEVDKALALVQAIYGENVPAMVSAYTTRGNIEFHQHDYKAANADYVRARDLAEAVVGPNTELASVTWMNVGNIALTEGRLDDTQVAYQHALDARLAASGPDDPALGGLYQNMARLATDRHDFDGALDYAKRAVAVKRRALGDTNSEVGLALVAEATDEMKLSQYDAAIADCEQAIAIEEKALPAAHPQLADARLTEAQALIGAKRPLDALPSIRKALAGLDGAPPNEPLRADARFLLGRAEWDAGADRRDARAQVEQAKAWYDKYKQTPSDERELGRINDWLAEHR